MDCALLQADICHAYQILRRNGVAEENIVVFMYDDIADNIENPRPGEIINSPTGSDVYHGVPKVGVFHFLLISLILSMFRRIHLLFRYLKVN